MSAAPDELQQAMVSLLEQFAHDETPIAQIHSHRFCEDGKTLLVIAEMMDGSDAYITLTPGRPICIHRTESAPPPTPKRRHLFSVPCEPVA